jgi:hypothetical protein
MYLTSLHPTAERDTIALAHGETRLRIAIPVAAKFYRPSNIPK